MKITLTKPQLKVSSSEARFRVLISGRRFGKTYLAVTEMMKYACQPNRRIWYVAPTFKMAKEIVWGTLKEMLNQLETKNQLFEQDLLEASVQKPIDQEQFMLLEHIAEGLEKLTIRVDDMMNNKVNIDRLQQDVERLRIDTEKLKDSVRANIGKLNGTH